LKKSWLCRDYKRGDEHQIVTLFREVFGREMSLSFWKWRFVQNPFGQGITKLLFDDNKLVGHYAVIPMNVQVEDKPVKAVFSMTTMTHPNYAGQGIFTYLAEETYRACQEKGFLFVYGFPNKNSYFGFTHKLGWQGQGKMTILEKQLQPKEKKRTIGKAIKQTECFDNTVNLLWDRVKRDYTIIVERTQEFLNWRFVDNPDVSYVKYVVSSNSDHILGYAILKVYIRQDMTIGHIVDMLSIAEKEVVKILLEHSFNYFLERGIRYISCWIPKNCFYNSILEEEGFIRKETETYFGTRLFEYVSSLKSTEQPSNWFLTMADSDAF
jgi:predicted acetyltransferase